MNEAAWPEWVPIQDEQTRTLFATFSKVFHTSDPKTRHAFTCQVLGKELDDVTSWSPRRDGTISANEAATLLAALVDLETTAV